ASPCSLSDFRPISVVSSLYKILMKVLSNRLRKELGLTIDGEDGFVIAFLLPWFLCSSTGARLRNLVMVVGSIK
ncbi:hypothetical protein Ddye_016208, partial [Dipteronia dyeriana]